MIETQPSQDTTQTRASECFYVRASSEAQRAVMKLLRLSCEPQWIELRLDPRVGVDFFEEQEHEDMNEEERAALRAANLADRDGQALIAVSNLGLVISADPDLVEGCPDETEPDLHAYRPLFVPWHMVFGICAYRMT